MKAALIILAVFGTCYGYGFMEMVEDENCTTPGVLFPHPDCTKYFICDANYELKVQSCPQGTYYSSANETCLFPRDVPECVEGTRPPVGSTTTTSATAAPNTTVSTTTLAPNTTVVPTTLPPNTTVSPTTLAPNTTVVPTTLAPNTTVEPTTLAPNTTVEPTTLAPNTTVVPTTLAPNTTVEPTTLAPNTTVVPTTLAPNTTEDYLSTTTNAPQICQREGVYTVAYPGNCSLYYLCANRIPTVRQCAEGTLYDPIRGTCNLANLVPGCSDDYCDVDEVSYTPVPGNCTIYIICAFGDVSAGFCPENTLFDPVYLECNAADKVNCTSAAHAFWDNKKVMNLLY